MAVCRIRYRRCHCRQAANCVADGMHVLLIEHGEHHEIRNTGKALLKTLNFYSPPGYTAAGNELAAAKP